MPSPLRRIPPAAALVGRVTAAAAAAATAPVQRRSLRNAQAAIALHRAGPPDAVPAMDLLGVSRPDPRQPTS